jgi:hypothetical protein
MVFNATFNIISVISWWSVLLVEKTGKQVMIFSNGNPGHGLENAQTCGGIKSVNGNFCQYVRLIYNIVF